MIRATPAYFFDEFLLPVSRKTPSERERALASAPCWLAV